MNTIQEREAIRKRLIDKRHRDAFVSACVDQTIPFQVRAMRLAKDRNWTQQELASRTGMKQERISTCENPNYGRFSLQTLKQLASAFDVALIVRFAPFSELVEWESNISPEFLEVPSFEQEKDYFETGEKEESESNVDFLRSQYIENTLYQQHNQSMKSDAHLTGYSTKSGIEKKMSSTQPKEAISGGL